jgi:hypothetical protein
MNGDCTDVDDVFNSQKLKRATALREKKKSSRGQQSCFFFKITRTRTRYSVKHANVRGVEESGSSSSSSSSSCSYIWTWNISTTFSFHFKPLCLSLLFARRCNNCKTCCDSSRFVLTAIKGWIMAVFSLLNLLLTFCVFNRVSSCCWTMFTSLLQHSKVWMFPVLQWSLFF